MGCHLQPFNNKTKLKSPSSRLSCPDWVTSLPASIGPAAAHRRGNARPRCCRAPARPACNCRGDSNLRRKSPDFANQMIDDQLAAQDIIVRWAASFVSSTCRRDLDASKRHSSRAAGRWQARGRSRRFPSASSLPAGDRHRCSSKFTQAFILEEKLKRIAAKTIARRRRPEP